LEFVPEESLIKFYGRTDLDNIIKRDGHLEGFRDSPVSITADNAEARITILRHREPETGPKILVKPDGIAEIINVNGFEVILNRKISCGTLHQILKISGPFYHFYMLKTSLLLVNFILRFREKM
jgi:hypothetical protein